MPPLPAAKQRTTNCGPPREGRAGYASLRGGHRSSSQLRARRFAVIINALAQQRPAPRTPGIDINVTTVWNDYNGSGVHVGVFHDEVEYTHHDLNNNYDASRHVFINGTRQKPAPVGNAEYHGTAVAGVIAAENDEVGMSGRIRCVDNGRGDLRPHE